MNKPVKKSVSIENLVVDFAVNNREKDNYDIVAMKDQILAIGRITTPIVVEPMRDENDVVVKDKFLVLQGNRRTLAGQEFWNDPTCPTELKESLKKLDVMVYEDLTTSERVSIIFDHGASKGLCKTECIKAVWRLDKAFYSEKSIITQMYFTLADFVDNKAKLRDVPENASAREAYLRTWLHGTVGNFILNAGRMGDFVRNEMVATYRKIDKLSKPDDKIRMECKRDRITKLSQAITKDKENGGWEPLNDVKDDGTFVGGGAEFNAMIAKFMSEDKTGVKDKGDVRPTVKELREKIDLYKSPMAQLALKIGAGDNPQENAKKLIELDMAMSDLQMKLDTLSKRIGEIADPRVQELVRCILKGPAGGVELALNALVG